MAHNPNVNRLESEYLSLIKTFSTEMTMKTLNDRINQLNEKNPKIKQLMRQSNNPKPKTPVRPFDSVTNVPGSAPAKRQRRNQKENADTRQCNERPKCADNMKDRSLHAMKSTAGTSSKIFNGFRSTIHASAVQNNVQEQEKEVCKRGRNFIEANKKNAFSAQKIGGFFEHNQFFTTIKETKRVN